MKATILEVCVGLPKAIEVNGKIEQSGIFKSPAKGKVKLSLNKLEGDGQANLEFHGGRAKSVYVYSSAHYPLWQELLGKGQLEPSQFGQNITVDGFPDEEVRIGDRFRLGTAIVEVAQPRIPCAKIAVRVGIEDFTQLFLMTGKLGYYLYTVDPGSMQAGDSMELIDRPNHEITVSMLWEAVFTHNRNLPLTELALQFPHIDAGWKKRLSALLGNKGGTKGSKGVRVL